MPVSSAAAPRRPATACRVWAASRQHWCRPSGCELLSGSNALPWSDAERLSLASCPGTGVSVETLPGVLLRCRSSLCSLGCFPLGSFSSMGSPWPLLIVLPVPFRIHFYLLGFEFFQSVSSLATLPRPFRQHVFSVGLQPDCVSLVSSFTAVPCLRCLASLAVGFGVAEAFLGVLSSGVGGAGPGSLSGWDCPVSLAL